MIWYCFSGAHILLFAVLLLLSYRAMLYVQKTNSIKLTVNELYDRVNSLSGCREEVGRKLAALYGNMGRRGPIAHISDNIEYSGVGSILPGLTPELYMLIMLMLSVAAYVLTGFISGNIYYGIPAAAVPWVAGEIFFSLLRNYRYRREEEQLLTLVNSIESCAAESDDIIYILEKAATMTAGPIHDELWHTVTMVKSGLQGAVALGQLESRIEHAFFKTLIRNLEISSRNNANYREITMQCRSLLTEQLDNTKKLEEIYREARIRLIVIFLCAIVCLEIMARTMSGMSLKGMLLMFSRSAIGCCLIAMMLGTLLMTAYFILAKGGGRRSR